MQRLSSERDFLVRLRFNSLASASHSGESMQQLTSSMTISKDDQDRQRYVDLLKGSQRCPLWGNAARRFPISAAAA